MQLLLQQLNRYSICIRLKDRFRTNDEFTLLGYLAFSYNFVESEAILMKSGALHSEYIAGGGPDRFWARSEQYRQFDKQAKLFFLPCT